MIKSRLGDEIDEAAVKEYNDTRTDWYGHCRHCGMVLRGTPAALREHVCKVKHGE